MSNTYNFDEIVSDDAPSIVMAGHNFVLRYPTVEEVENLQTLKTDQERTDAIYSFVIQAEGEKASFRDVLRKQDVRVMKAFTDMVKKEFGVE